MKAFVIHARHDHRRAEAFAREFSVEGYLEAQTERFVNTFDANCYLYLSRAMDRFDLSAHGGSPEIALSRSGLVHALVIGVESDMLFAIDDGNDLDTYADDLAELVQHLGLKNAIHIGHSTGGGGEVARYIGRHGTTRVAKAVLIGAIPPLMLKTPANPESPRRGNQATPCGSRSCEGAVGRRPQQATDDHIGIRRRPRCTSDESRAPVEGT